MKQNLFKRLWQHIIHPRHRVKRHFPTAALQQISRQIAQSERKHWGEIRFVVESCYPIGAIVAGITPRQRAQQWFADLGIWDTEHNTGILVYIGFADHAVEIIADRGIAQRVNNDTWHTVCQNIAQAFRNEDYIGGLTRGLTEIDAVLLREFPNEGDDIKDELSNDLKIV